MTSVEFNGNLMRVQGLERSSETILVNIRNVIAFSDIFHIQANEYYKTERWSFNIYLPASPPGTLLCHFETKAEAEKAWSGLVERLK